MPEDEGGADLGRVFCEEEVNCFLGHTVWLGGGEGFGAADILRPVDSRVVVEVLDWRRFLDKRRDARACGTLTEAGGSQELVRRSRREDVLLAHEFSDRRMTEREDVGVIVEYNEIVADVDDIHALRFGQLDVRI